MAFRILRGRDLWAYGGTYDNPLQRMGKITEAEITDIEIVNIIQRDNVGHPCMVRMSTNVWEFLNRGNEV